MSGLGPSGFYSTWIILAIILMCIGVCTTKFFDKRRSIVKTKIAVKNRGLLTTKEMILLIRGGYPAVNAKYRGHRDKLTVNLLLSLFYMESGFNTLAGDMGGHYGLGQMGEAAASDVDRFVYGRKSETTTKMVRSGRAIDQIAGTIVYLDLLLYRNKGDIKEALRRYGPTDVGYDYANALLDCEEEMNAGDLSVEECLIKMKERYRR